MGCLSQRIEALLASAVLFVFDNNQRIVEEQAFSFRRADVVLVRAFAAAATVRFEPDNAAGINHMNINTDLQSVRVSVKALSLQADGVDAWPTGAPSNI